MYVRYMLRLDDACETMARDKWIKIELLLNRHRIKPIVAVIPENKDQSLIHDLPDPEFWAKVHNWQDNDWQIAIHGFQHLYTTKVGGLVPISSKSEFAGLPLEIQREKLRLARLKFLSEGIDPIIWVAPSHSFDQNTLKALSLETAVRIISDGIALRPFRAYGYNWIPQQLWRFRILPIGMWTICLHPNNMTNSDFIFAENFIAKYHAYFIKNLFELKFSESLNFSDKVFIKFYWRLMRRKHHV